MGQTLEKITSISDLADAAEKHIFAEHCMREGSDGTTPLYPLVPAGLHCYGSRKGFAYDAVYDAVGGLMTPEAHSTAELVGIELARRGVIKPDNRKHYGDKIDWAWRVSRAWWNRQQKQARS